MTPQDGLRTRRAAAGILALAVAGMFTLAGCDPRALAYFLGEGTEVPAPGPSLEEKKVIFVTIAAPSAGAEAIDREINREVVSIIRSKVEKIEVVDPQKVSIWLDAHPAWSDPEEIIKAFEADLVVVFEIQTFSTEDSRSPNLLEGNAAVHIKVTELAHPKNSKGKVNKSAPKEINKLYETDWTATFPKTAPISVESGMARPAFRSKFLKLVASELAWQFTGHDNKEEFR